MSLAPIVLFVYNRPEHTRRTLEALSKNKEAQESELFIFADGIPENASEIERENIKFVRQIIRKDKWCGQVEIVESKDNKGLADSVISGVSKIVNSYGKVIVLEDDIVTAPYFLTFMNNGLNQYSAVQKVYGITGHKFKSFKKVNDPIYFLPVMSSWGYGTWADRWNSIDWNGKKLLREVNKLENPTIINFGTIDYYNMLIDQVEGKNDSWAVRFYVSMYLKGGIFLYPYKSLLKNIGLDGSGTHCDNLEIDVKSIVEVYPENIEVNQIPTKVSPSIYKSFIQTNKSIFFRVKKRLKKIVPSQIKRVLRPVKDTAIEKELKRLSSIPRYTQCETTIFQDVLEIPDSASFLFMYKEIFQEEIYNFKAETRSPFIIDGGANIGLASIYFKQKYPRAEIIAFEPDKEIAEILRSNLNQLGLHDVIIEQKGLWEEKTELLFNSEGADAGLIDESGADKTDSQTIEVVPLSEYINRRVDFLKLDIEGAETKVITEIKPKLKYVERIFIEYHSFIGQPQTLNEIIDILREQGFRLYIKSPGIKSKSPFMKINTYNNMDMQLNIYGLKEF